MGEILDYIQHDDWILKHYGVINKNPAWSRTMYLSKVNQKHCRFASPYSQNSSELTCQYACPTRNAMAF